MRNTILLVLALITLGISNAQEVLTNQSIIDLIELGFEEQVVIDKIESSATNFDTTVAALKLLKEKKVSSLVLSAMIKTTKKSPKDIGEPEKKPTPPKPDDTSFYWENGKGELVKVRFYNSLINEYELDEFELSGWTNRIMMEAKNSLNVKLSFVPTFFFINKREKIHRTLTKNDKTSHVAQLSYAGTNSYGGMVEENIVIGINPTLKLKENTSKSNISSTDSLIRKFTFKKVYMDGNFLKMGGSLVFTDEYIDIQINDSPELPSTLIENKEVLGDNHWKSQSVKEGVSLLLEYNGNETKYKSDGGILKVTTMGMEIIYLLIKQ